MQIEAVQGGRNCADLNSGHVAGEDKVKDTLNVQKAEVGLGEQEIDQLDCGLFRELLLEECVLVKALEDVGLNILEVGEVGGIAEFDGC